MRRNIYCNQYEKKSNTPLKLENIRKRTKSRKLTTTFSRLGLTISPLCHAILSSIYAQNFSDFVSSQTNGSVLQTSHNSVKKRQNWEVGENMIEQMEQNADGETQLWKEISRSATSIGESRIKEETKRGRKGSATVLQWRRQCVYRPDEEEEGE